MARCSRCKRFKNSKHFHKCLSRRNGLQRHCKKCRKKIDHDRYAADPAKHREVRKRYAAVHKKEMRYYHIEKKYGLTEIQWISLFEKQGNKCGICRSRKSGNRKIGWATDHNHKTKKTRGILCHRCNTMLGGSRDMIPVLRKAIRYLRKWDS
jgi:hypothetical protein